MENFHICLSCDEIATHICRCSNLFFCDIHARKHVFSSKDFTSHNIARIALKHTEQEKIRLKYELEFRKNTANNFKKQIIRETLLLINQITILSHTSCYLDINF